MDVMAFGYRLLQNFFAQERGDDVDTLLFIIGHPAERKSQHTV